MSIWKRMVVLVLTNVLRLCEVGDFTHQSRLEALIFNLSTKA
jgi:hypothetical protein